jgi:outer membrane protein OmpA-like peptidoglycan-associated protein
MIPKKWMILTRINKQQAYYIKKQAFHLCWLNQKKNKGVTLSMRLLYLCALIFVASHCVAQDTVTRVYFEFDKFNLAPKAKRQLDNFANAYIKKKRNAPIGIKGFCDSVGSLEYNDSLSAKRVKTVYHYLLSHKIQSTAFNFMKGYGKREPVNNNLTEKERQLNRRVEISLIKQDSIKQDTIVVTNVTSPERKDSVKDFSSSAVDSVKEGEVLRLKNINFYGGRHTFLPQATPALNELLAVMKKYPALEIEIQGHICCQFGTGRDGVDFDSGDEHLSINRARAVYYFLAYNGISKRRMTYHGFAALHPLVYPENTEADKTLNRRVEIKIIKK